VADISTENNWHSNNGGKSVSQKEYMIEVYDEAEFERRFPRLSTLAQKEKERHGVKTFHFIQCLSFDGTVTSVTYAGEDEETSLCVEVKGDEIQGYVISQSEVATD
jgi:hypothetical protein